MRRGGRRRDERCARFRCTVLSSLAALRAGPRLGRFRHRGLPVCAAAAGHVAAARLRRPLVRNLPAADGGLAARRPQPGRLPAGLVARVAARARLGGHAGARDPYLGASRHVSASQHISTSRPISARLSARHSALLKACVLAVGIFFDRPCCRPAAAARPTSRSLLPEFNARAEDGGGATAGRRQPLLQGALPAEQAADGPPEEGGEPQPLGAAVEEGRGGSG